MTTEATFPGKNYASYWIAMMRYALKGSTGYYAWLGALLAIMGVGAVAYSRQWQIGLAVTNLSDQVSWGAYIANFTYLVGVAAAAVLLVVPSYAFGNTGTKRVAIVGELMAVSAICMCLGFIFVDLGRPERGLHMLLRLNFPDSVLAWDVIVLSGYLFLNLHVPGYQLYQYYRGQQLTQRFYVPFVFLSMGWAVSIHTVTAFLYSGFGGRPYWNTAILAPRFLVSAFAAGPALLILVFLILDRFDVVHAEERVLNLLRRIALYTFPLNYFLLACEVFKEFYTQSAHVASSQYLFFGLHGHGMLVPYVWSGLALGIASFFVLLVPRLHHNKVILALGCVAGCVGIWVEKGMGLIIPGFIPTPAGDLVEYQPSMTETLVSAGIWAMGAFMFTVMVRVAAAIQSGRLRARSQTASRGA